MQWVHCTSFPLLKLLFICSLFSFVLGYDCEKHNMMSSLQSWRMIFSWFSSSKSLDLSNKLIGIWLQHALFLHVEVWSLIIEPADSHYSSFFHLWLTIYSRLFLGNWSFDYDQSTLISLFKVCTQPVYCRLEAVFYYMLIRWQRVGKWTVLKWRLP
jgi:hypothetical protein